MTGDLQLADIYETQKMSSLKKSHVHMKDEFKVLEKINKIAADGADKLQFVADFDQTVTKQHVNGIRTPYSYGLFIECESIDESVKSTQLDILKKFSSILKDPNLPLEDKKSAAILAYQSTHEDLQNINFDYKELDAMAIKYDYLLRDGTQELFTNLKNLDVPTLVLSAGLSDVIEAMLRNQEVMFDNIKIISNFLKVEGDTLGGYRNIDNLIYPFNKQEHAVKHEFSDIFRARTNAILIGDELQDAVMVDPDATETVLRIGFLYGYEDERLSSYKDTFDIVLVNDQTMDVILEILSFIASSKVAEVQNGLRSK